MLLKASCLRGCRRIKMKTERKKVQNGMKSKRMISCLLFTFIILLLQSGNLAEAYGAQTSPFPDVFLGQWFSEAVIRAKEEGVLGGYPDGNFCPDRTVTYGEFLRMAVKNAPDEKQGHWADSYYAEGIRRQLFAEEEISKGALDKPISRKYMALVLAGLLDEAGAIKEIFGGNGAESESMSSLNFVDIDSRSAFRGFIAQSAAVGVLTGYPDRAFRPENFLTRAEAATAFVRLSDVLATAVASTDNDASGSGGNKTPQADNDAARSIEDVMEPAYKAYLDFILQSLRVTGTGGNYRYRFDIPEAPEESKVYFDISFFSKTGGQILNDQTYTSQDSSPRTVDNRIKGLHSLSELGTAGFNFAIKPKSSGDWHDYMLIWKTNNELTLRAEHSHEFANSGFSKYSTRALDYIFSWQ
ncbi:MAG: S-layer homology domain-containing protein [Clostridia bacterium]|nr:S-layer homology domain-containing protein [Clostridia bacterium]